ncbi:MAG: hypothetical protein J6J60_02965 [Clostridia bacterium]|nr:hypothetical protein [Clostridia bacterium]
MKNQKIITLALGLLIIAGIIVVALKGFNVDFMLKQHDSIEYSMDSEFEISDVEKITSEVLKDKKFKVRIIELFNDAISINAETITTEEAEQITKKLDEKYKKTEQQATAENAEPVADSANTENTENAESENTEIIESQKEEYKIITNPKIKLSSLFKPYIVPIIISGIAIIIYAAIRFRKLNSKKVIINLVSVITITVLSILSVIAIIRFPVNTLVIPFLMLIVLFELVFLFSKYEKDLKK